MDLRFTPEEQAFRDEVRAFIRDNLPAEIRERMRLGYGAAQAGHRGLAAHPEQARLGGDVLAEGMGRAGLDLGAEDDLPGGEPDRAGAGAVVVQHHHARPGADPVRHRGAEEALPAARRQPR